MRAGDEQILLQTQRGFNEHIQHYAVIPLKMIVFFAFPLPAESFDQIFVIDKPAAIAIGLRAVDKRAFRERN